MGLLSYLTAVFCIALTQIKLHEIHQVVQQQECVKQEKYHHYSWHWQCTFAPSFDQYKPFYHSQLLACISEHSNFQLVHSTFQIGGKKFCQLFQTGFLDRISNQHNCFSILKDLSIYNTRVPSKQIFHEVHYWFRCCAIHRICFLLNVPENLNFWEIWLRTYLVSWNILLIFLLNPSNGKQEVFQKWSKPFNCFSKVTQQLHIVRHTIFSCP